MTVFKDKRVDLSNQMPEFLGKKVAILGTGVEGLSSAVFLKKQGAHVTLLDQKSYNELSKETVEKVFNLGVGAVWGDNYLDILERFDIIVRTPVIRPDLPQLLSAAKKGIQITSNTRIFFDLCPAQIIGVTGTKGKGTTSTLISEILKKAGKKVFLGGNIGKPPLDFLEEIHEEDLVVLELSSFQLFDLDKSPQVGVVLMVTSEHLDWHTTDQEYKTAKANILSHQTGSDFGIVNIDYPVTKEFLEIGEGKKIKVSTKSSLESGVFLEEGAIYRVFDKKEKVIETKDIGLIGPHNVENVVSAVAAVSALGVEIDPIVNAVKEFKGLEHRLEFVRELNGVSYYNDTFSTTPETAIAAIKSFSQPEIVILGGSDKGSDYTQLGKVIAQSENVKALVLIGKMAPNIKSSIEKAGGFNGKILEGAENMEEIVTQAKSVSSYGDIVLLSPACASFDMFANYKDRGNQFKATIKKL